MPADNTASGATADRPADGAVFLPAHALHIQEDRLTCNGLLFVRVDGQTWSSIEALWMRDQELDIWLGHERVFAVMPYKGDASSGGEAVFMPAFAAYSAIVAAARLNGAGVWIDAAHLAAVARGADGVNLRLAGSGRPRLWAAVFGEPLKVRSRRRELRDRVECRPTQFHLPHGSAYTMDAERSRKIEGSITVLAQLHELAPHHGWWIAHRAFQRGHDIFRPRRLRLTALFSAFEAVFGPFRREAGDPGIGAAVAITFSRAGLEVRDTAAYVERALRQARNRLAHGSDLALAIDFAAVEENLLDLLRVGLTFSSAWIRGMQQPDGPIAPGVGRTLFAFQRWLGRVISDED